MNRIADRVIAGFLHKARSVRVLIDRDATIKARSQFPAHPEGVVASFDTSLTLYRIFDGEELSRILRSGKITGGTYAVRAERAYGASWGENLSAIIQWGNGHRGGRLGAELFVAKLDAFDKSFYHLGPNLPFDPDGPPKQEAVMDASVCNLGLGCSVIDVDISDVDLFTVAPDGQMTRLSVSEAKDLVGSRPQKDVDLRQVNSQLLQGSILGVDVRVLQKGAAWQVVLNDDRVIATGAPSKEDAIELAQMSIRLRPARPVPVDMAILQQRRNHDKHFEQDEDESKVRGSFGLKPKDRLVVEKGSRELGVQSRDVLTVADVYQRKGGREVFVKLLNGSKVLTLYATHANRLKDSEIALMNSKGNKVVTRLKTAVERVAARYKSAADPLERQGVHTYRIFAKDYDNNKFEFTLYTVVPYYGDEDPVKAFVEIDLDKQKTDEYGYPLLSAAGFLHVDDEVLANVRRLLGRNKVEWLSHKWVRLDGNTYRRKLAL